MKCPKCVEEGKKSTLSSNGGFTTAMKVLGYYDEEGNCHSNIHSRTYYCSNNHSFQVKGRSGCRAKGCEWVYKEEIILV